MLNMPKEKSEFTIYFVRHGETEYNSKKLTQGWLNRLASHYAIIYEEEKTAAFD